MCARVVFDVMEMCGVGEMCVCRVEYWLVDWGEMCLLGDRCVCSVRHVFAL